MAVLPGCPHHDSGCVYLADCSQAQPPCGGKTGNTYI